MVEFGELKKRVIQAIVNIFETGSPHGDYGKVTVIPGDPGHLTYGRSQTTLASGNLFLLLKSYCENGDALYRSEISNYLNRVAARDYSLDFDTSFKSLLKKAADDPVMQSVQDDFFDRVYWEPALRAATILKLEFPLSVAVVYDSHIHGSWVKIKSRVVDKLGYPHECGEKEWVEAYVNTRKEWLATHPIEILRRTVYRMDTFLNLISENRWQLELPLWIRGIRLDEATVSFPPVVCSADDEERRLLKLQVPYMKGEDVKAVQEALRKAGYSLIVDGIFGPQTQECVKSFQRDHNLVVDGIVGPATISVLGVDI